MKTSDNTHNETANEALSELVALQTRQNEIINSEFKGTLNDLETLSNNHINIDALNSSNEDILSDLSATFQEKLAELKSNTDLSNKEAINQVFKVLDITILGNEDVHKKAIKVYNDFKRYYTSKVYIHKSLFNYKNLVAIMKLDKYVGVKTLNVAIKAYNADSNDTLKPLNELRTLVNDISKSAKSINEKNRTAIREATKHYINFKGDKVSIDKSNLTDIKEMTEVLANIRKAIVIANVTGTPLALEA
jgi:hypothetical protein